VGSVATSHRTGDRRPEPERILFDNDTSIHFDELGAHEGELPRRESAIRIIWGLRANPNRLSGYWQLDSKAPYSLTEMVKVKD
jgi:hypothetical protein